ncbi:FAD/NAD(P)-binding domain-containing protein [Gyrodon lividus]|nr:FAD/NAD(P)-binding domain-containing protein [Gyrodon lividus]
MKPNFRVSICGGGIGGLTLALMIGKYSTIPVDVYEASPQIATIGAGIGFFGRTMDIMKELGLYEELVQLGIGPPQENTGPNFRKSDQQDGYHWFTRKLKRGTLLAHRKDLVNLLLRHIPTSCKVQMSKGLELYDVTPETDTITLHFSDGSTAITDVLLGADGIRSVARKTMYRQLASLCQDDESRKKILACIDPVWTGALVYRNLVPTTKLLKEYPGVEAPTELTLHLGKNKHIVTYPISQGRLLNVVIFRQDYHAFGKSFEGHWVVDVSEKEILDTYEDWEPRARALVKCVERPSRWALHTLRPLPHYVHGRVALLGDAAHAMEPHFGAGAGQAIEDAFILGRLLTHELTHRGNVADALKIYEEVRLPFANRILQSSHDIGQSYAFHRVSDDQFTPVHGSQEELDYVHKSIENAWEWQSESDWVWGDAEARWRTKYGARPKL